MVRNHRQSSIESNNPCNYDRDRGKHERCILTFEYFFYAFSCFAIAHNIWAIANIRWATSWIASERLKPYFNEPETFVLIVIPMLHEQEIAEETIRHFLQLEYDISLYKVLIITSARERPRQQETTYDVVQRVLSTDESGRILHFHTDGNDTTKSDQMNQALKWLDEVVQPWWTENAIVGVYDADSRPELHTLRGLDRAARDNPYDCAFQQPAMYVSGFDHLPSGLRGAYLRSRPIYNLRFCMFREIPGFYRSMIATRSTSAGVRTVLSSPNHFLGHGEFIRSNTLSTVGGFPRPSADTSLGTMLSFMGHAVVPLSSFDIGQTPASAGMLIKQGATWYAGCALYFEDLAAALSKGSRLSLVHLVMLFKRWLENMIWATGPMLLLPCFVWAHYSQNMALFLASAFVGILHLLSVLQIIRFYLNISPEISIGRVLPTINKSKAALMVLTYPFMLLGTCLGPLLHYFYRFRTMLTGRTTPRSKTDRIPILDTRRVTVRRTHLPGCDSTPEDSVH